ncbi:MAG: hypothetical protein ACTTH5_07600 [Wolinella sp.]
MHESFSVPISQGADNLLVRMNMLSNHTIKLINTLQKLHTTPLDTTLSSRAIVSNISI